MSFLGWFKKGPEESDFANIDDKEELGKVLKPEVLDEKGKRTKPKAKKEAGIIDKAEAFVFGDNLEDGKEELTEGKTKDYKIDENGITPDLLEVNEKTSSTRKDKPKTQKVEEPKKPEKIITDFEFAANEMTGGVGGTLIYKEGNKKMVAQIESVETTEKEIIYTSTTGEVFKKTIESDPAKKVEEKLASAEKKVEQEIASKDKNRQYTIKELMKMPQGRKILLGVVITAAVLSFPIVGGVAGLYGLGAAQFLGGSGIFFGAMANVMNGVAVAAGIGGGVVLHKLMKEWEDLNKNGESKKGEEGAKEEKPEENKESDIKVWERSRDDIISKMGSLKKSLEDTEKLIEESKKEISNTKPEEKDKIESYNKLVEGLEKAKEKILKDIKKLEEDLKFVDDNIEKAKKEKEQVVKNSPEEASKKTDDGVAENNSQEVKEEKDDIDRLVEKKTVNSRKRPTIVEVPINQEEKKDNQSSDKIKNKPAAPTIKPEKELNIEDQDIKEGIDGILRLYNHNEKYEIPFEHVGKFINLTFRLINNKSYKYLEKGLKKKRDNNDNSDIEDITKDLGVVLSDFMKPNSTIDSKKFYEELSKLAKKYGPQPKQRNS